MRFLACDISSNYPAAGRADAKSGVAGLRTRKRAEQAIAGESIWRSWPSTSPSYRRATAQIEKNVDAIAGAVHDDGEGLHARERSRQVRKELGANLVAQIGLASRSAENDMKQESRVRVGHSMSPLPGLAAIMAYFVPWLSPWANDIPPLAGLLGSFSAREERRSRIFLSEPPVF